MTIHQNTVPGQLADELADLKLALRLAACYLGDVETLLDDPRATRLAACRIGRRNLDQGARLDLESLDILQWLLEEGTEQVEALTGALGVLTEPVRDSRTHYGVETGILANAPYDWGRCGTPAAYQAHRRRGQDCQACRKAAARYEAERRRCPGSVGALSL
jgi:hypothetical protein